MLLRNKLSQLCNVDKTEKKEKRELKSQSLLLLGYKKTSSQLPTGVLSYHASFLSDHCYSFDESPSDDDVFRTPMRRQLDDREIKKRRSINLEEFFKIKPNNNPSLHDDDDLFDAKEINQTSKNHVDLTTRSELSHRHKIQIYQSPKNKLHKLSTINFPSERQPSGDNKNTKEGFNISDKVDISLSVSSRSSFASSTYSVDSVFENAKDFTNKTTSDRRGVLPTNTDLKHETLTKPTPTNFQKAKKKNLGTPFKLTSVFSHSIRRAVDKLPATIISHINASPVISKSFLRKSIISMTPKRLPTNVTPHAASKNSSPLAHGVKTPLRHHGLRLGKSVQDRRPVQDRVIRSRTSVCKFRLGSSGDRRSSSPPRITSKDIHKIKLVELIGQGGFGAVYLGVYKDRIVAVKKLYKQVKNVEAKLESFKAECNVLGLKHVRIVQVLAASLNYSRQEAVIVMEHAGEVNLLMLLNDHSINFSWRRRVKYSLEIAEGIEFIHYQDILHLDIKPANVMITSNDFCKIGDFGCCRNIGSSRDKPSPSPDNQMTNFSSIIFDHKFNHILASDTINFFLSNNNSNNNNKINNSNNNSNKNNSDNAGSNSHSNPPQKSVLEGTPVYRAPELLKGETPSPQCDVYSLGITMWQLESRQMPFQGKDPHSVIFSVVALNTRPSFDQETNQDFVVSKCNVTEKRKIFERSSDYYKHDYLPESASNVKSSLSDYSMELRQNEEEEVVRNAYRDVVMQCWSAQSQHRPTITQLISIFRTWIQTKLM